MLKKYSAAQGQGISTPSVLAEWAANCAGKHLIVVSIYVDAKTSNFPLKSKEKEVSATESLTADSEDDSSTVTSHGSESLMTGDSKTEEEEADPRMPMLEKVMQEHKTAFQGMKSVADPG